LTVQISFKSFLTAILHRSSQHAFHFQTPCRDSGFETFTVVTHKALSRRLHVLHYLSKVVRLLGKHK